MNTYDFRHEDLLPPWSPSFPPRLADFAACHSLAHKGLSTRTYSTNNFLAAQSSSVTTESNQDQTWTMCLEALSQSNIASFDGVGLRFKPISTSLAASATGLFRDVQSLLEQDTGISASVESLVRAIHIIESTGPGYDCSFSDPTIPFSIFISIPEDSEKNRLLRTFEGILHECMHLQLSCYELSEPLVRAEANQSTWYSPWKKSRRKVQGILHGMYVFHVIAYMYETLIGSGELTELGVKFSRQRLTEISEELHEVKGVEQCPDLTAAGTALAQAILSPSYFNVR